MTLEMRRQMANFLQLRANRTAWSGRDSVLTSVIPLTTGPLFWTPKRRNTYTTLPEGELVEVLLDQGVVVMDLTINGEARNGGDAVWLWGCGLFARHRIRRASSTQRWSSFQPWIEPVMIGDQIFEMRSRFDKPTWKAEDLILKG